ncbi:hypothetical protein BC938DRAFT_473697 [Jimgerdemannia flammicorona]|uniref:Serine hydrolase domain-containing protein n=1 Tax=Jimgerdemannia flammicorona TaxID=994334 RepID=A0A433Q3L3_9FUNG|nr:hypothetical protein BC938DRAFT_473697 [Jimgerdemannia flammicorona]
MYTTTIASVMLRIRLRLGLGHTIMPEMIACVGSGVYDNYPLVIYRLRNIECHVTFVAIPRVLLKNKYINSMSTTPVTPPIAAPVAAPKRLRILCLHGYAQNGIIFNKKTAVLRKSWDDVADLVYVTAPLRVMVPDLPTVKEREEDTQQEVSEEMSPYAWWFYQPSGVTYKDLESSIAFLKNVLENEGPFDGILGFSQGNKPCCNPTQSYRDPATIFQD